MPGKDGTGPQGQGSRSGLGLGDCISKPTQDPNATGLGKNLPTGRRGGFWNATFGRLFRRRRGNRRL